MELILAFLLTPSIYVATVAVSLFTYFFNMYVLRAKKEYIGLRLKESVFLAMIPGINLVFLTLNISVACIKFGRYKFVKVRRRSVKTTSKVVPFSGTTRKTA